ncbi:hypothetical protein BDZ97DRAFT_1760921 [Flammula alnicola]|nr:hypothetical protein BDZ97DRAFT_1760921 [Flammula alnicola]
MYLVFDPFKANKAAKVQKIKDLINSSSTKKTSYQDYKLIHLYLITNLESNLVKSRSRRERKTLGKHQERVTYELNDGKEPTHANWRVATITEEREKKEQKRGELPYIGNYSLADIFAEITNTIETYELETKFEETTVTLYNIYICFSINDYEEFQAWISAIHGVKYVSLIGHCTPQPIFNCSQCHGIDQPTGL